MLAFIGMGIIGTILLFSSGVYVERAVSRVGKLATVLTFVLIPLTLSMVYIMFTKTTELVKTMGDEVAIAQVLRFSHSEWIMLLVYISCIVLHFITSSLYRRKVNQETEAKEEK